MVLLARMITRLLGILVLALLALAGLVAAVFCLQGAHRSLSLPSLAADLHLADLRHGVASFLHQLEAHGPVAAVSASSGAGAMALGVMILVGSVLSPRERLIVIARGEDGVIAVHPRPLAQAATMLAQRPAAVGRVKARVHRSRRRGRTRLRVRVEVDQVEVERVEQLAGSPSAPKSGLSRPEVAAAVTGALAPLADSLDSAPRVLVKRGRAARRRR
ncbi:MAG: hypothetical protein ACR2LV_02205 [Solirubrobacteraceae bacterium]